MRVAIAIVAAALCLAACVKSEAPVDPKVKAVLDAGNTVLATVKKCVTHIQKMKNAEAAECDASAQFKAYTDARLQVTTPGVPALQAMDEQVQLARLEGMAAVMKLTK